MNTEAIERRLREFVAETDELDWEDVLHRARKTPLRRIPRRRLVLALAACAVAAAAAVGLSDLLGSSHTKAGPSAEPQHFSPIDFAFTRDADGGLTSIDVTIKAATLGGTALLQVVHGWPDEGSEVPSPSQVVFQEQVRMTDIASPISGPPGTEALSSWSGTLSPSDWNGGCQAGHYEVYFKVSPAHPTIEASGESVLSGYFRCTSG